MDFLNRVLPTSGKKRSQLLTMVIGVIAIVALTGIVWFFLRASNQSATVLFINNSDCPEVTLTLLGDGNVLTSSLKPGEREEIDVIPDITYEFEVNANSDPDDAGYSCLDIEPGQLTVPRGSTQTINFESVQRPYFIWVNDTECPRVTLNLWEAEDIRANIDPVTLAPGEEANVEITPDKEFEYRIRMDSDIDGDERCYEVESGTIKLGFDKSDEIRIATLPRVEPTANEGE